VIHKIIKFFDRLEDHVREKLSEYPLIYGLIGGIAIVVFWRAIWEIFDNIEIFNGISGGLLTLGISMVVLLGTGLFVSFFVGDRIIISGLKHEKRLEEKALEEIEKEFDIITHLKTKLDNIEKNLIEINDKIK